MTGESDDRLDALRYHVNCRSTTEVVEPEKGPETVDIAYWCDRCGVRRPVSLREKRRPWDIEKLIRCYGECDRKTLHWAETGYPEWDPVRLEYRCTDCGYETVFYEEPGDRVVNIPCEQCPTEGSDEYVLEGSGEQFEGETVIDALRERIRWVRVNRSAPQQQVVSPSVMSDLRESSNVHECFVPSTVYLGALAVDGVNINESDQADHPEVLTRVEPDVGALFLTKSVHRWEIEERG